LAPPAAAPPPAPPAPSAVRVHAAAAAALAGLVLFAGLLFFRHHINNFVGNSQIFDRVPANVALRQLPEAVAVAARADDVLEIHVHPGVGADELAVVRVAVFQLNQHRLARGRRQEAQRQHVSPLLCLAALWVCFAGRRGARAGWLRAQVMRLLLAIVSERVAKSTRKSASLGRRAPGPC
ncbi:unnamed protein product, partial [Pelagomonas calceolata]